MAPPTNSDAFWLSLISGVVFVVYLDHFVHALGKWRRERSARSFRNFFIAIMLQTGFLRIWLGATVRAYPAEHVLATAQNITAPVLTLLLLSGGFVLMATWRWEEHRERRP